MYRRGVRVKSKSEEGGREDGGKERQQTSCISCWSLLFCTSSVLRERCSFSFLSISCETETQLYHHLQSHTTLVPRPHGRRKRLSSLCGLGMRLVKCIHVHRQTPPEKPQGALSLPNTTNMIKPPRTFSLYCTCKWSETGCSGNEAGTRTYSYIRTSHKYSQTKLVVLPF